jgi:hypothetical protein
MITNSLLTTERRRVRDPDGLELVELRTRPNMVRIGPVQQLTLLTACCVSNVSRIEPTTAVPRAPAKVLVVRRVDRSWSCPGSWLVQLAVSLFG